ncbi:uncharacterized protein TNCV_4342351 [Trichonephila clavipes]|nr:uncharacterized protein TNCV_4342351 [Trichonephila clavipes]
MVATREINRENMEATREMDKTMEVGENQMVDGENRIANGEDQNDMDVDLLKIWTQLSKNATLDENHCVERILGRDNVRSSDLIKLISILHKISDPKTVYEFLAMDGYQGDDPKKYVELFRYDAQDARGKHVQAVRLLYHHEVVNTPQEYRYFLESVFDGTCTNTEYKDMYVEYVRGQEADMAEWC